MLDVLSITSTTATETRRERLSRFGAHEMKKTQRPEKSPVPQRQATRRVKDYYLYVILSRPERRTLGSDCKFLALIAFMKCQRRTEN